MEYYRDLWAEFDPNATSFMDKEDFPEFMIRLGAPLGWD